MNSTKKKLLDHLQEVYHEEGGLDVAILQVQNILRAERWSLGRHEWLLSDWVVEFIGEIGEACNKIKKLRRIECGMPGNRPHETEEWLKKEIGLELGDALVCLALLANAAGIDLSVNARSVFNAKSAQLNFPERI